MRLSLAILAICQLGTALPHGPDEEMEVPKSSVTPAIPAVKPIPAANITKPFAAVKNSTVTPAGCKKLPTDADWPTSAEWTEALPRVVPRVANLAPGLVRPDYHLTALNVSDVQAAVKFCAKHDIRLTIINSGHDFLGRNNAFSGLSLDVSKLGGVKILESFTPTAEGAESPGKKTPVLAPTVGKQAAVTFGAGMSTQRLNNALHASKLMTMGAAHGTVTVAGGWGQTAGHGPLTAQYGLGVDQFLEFKVVTADGELKVANKVMNPDLFWALRGGGGSTFGVVVEATVKAYPDIPITVTTWWLNSSDPSGDGLWDAYTYIHTQFPDMVSKNISGYYYLYPSSFRANMVHPAETSGAVNAEKFWKPYLAKMSSFANMSKATVQFNEYANFKQYFDGRFGKIDGDEDCMTGMPMRKRHGPGEDMAEPVPQAMAPLDSRLLGASHFANPNLKAALRGAAPNVGGRTMGGLQGHLVTGGKASRPDDDTSVLPAWRSAYTHLIGVKIPGQTSLDTVRKLAPESGAYANEAYWGEENWKETFWGVNYPKLSQIKEKHDPNMVFWTTPGINADYMQVVDNRVCKVTPVVGVKIAPKIDNTNAPRRPMVVAENNPDNVSTRGPGKATGNACKPKVGGARDAEYAPSPAVFRFAGQ